VKRAKIAALLPDIGSSSVDMAKPLKRSMWLPATSKAAITTLATQPRMSPTTIWPMASTTNSPREAAVASPDAAVTTGVRNTDRARAAEVRPMLENPRSPKTGAA
jgi:hypothetical protein